MAYLIFILITLALLIGFFAVMWYEHRCGTRFFGQTRTRLDEKVARIEFIFAHVDLAAFTRDEIRRATAYLGHAMVHLSLQAVRATERLLTRLVRHLRPSHSVDAAPRESTRPFVRALSDFKDRLKATHPEISDIQ